MFHSEWQDGKRRRGGQEQSFRRSIMSDLDCFNIAYKTAEEYSSLKDTCKKAEVWRKCVDTGSAFCLSKWLSERAVVKAKRDAANEVKMADLLTAIDAGSVCVKRGGVRNVTPGPR